MDREVNYWNKDQASKKENIDDISTFNAFIYIIGVIIYIFFIKLSSGMVIYIIMLVGRVVEDKL